MRDCGMRKDGWVSQAMLMILRMLLGHRPFCEVEGAPCAQATAEGQSGHSVETPLEVRPAGLRPSAEDSAC